MGHFPITDTFLCVCSLALAFFTAGLRRLCSIINYLGDILDRFTETRKSHRENSSFRRHMLIGYKILKASFFYKCLLEDLGYVYINVNNPHVACLY